MTALRQPFYAMGSVAFTILSELIKGGTRPSSRVELATELIIRNSTAPLPQQAGEFRTTRGGGNAAVGVADLTCVSTRSGWIYVAFAVDAYARRILGWRGGTSMTTRLSAGSSVCLSPAYREMANSRPISEKRLGQ